jgi:fumarate reductase flavoprotein subunit
MIQQGFVFEQVEASTYQTVPRSHPINAGHVVSVLHERLITKTRFNYGSNCRAKNLICDLSGHVTGVQYEDHGIAKQVHARHAVIIATGGFARSDRLIEKFAPEFSQAVRMGGVSNEGDGLLMAWELGADLIDTGYLSGTFGASLNSYPDISDRSGRECFLMHPIFKGGIAVNKNGQRFVDESQSYKTIGGKCLQQPDGVAFQIFDQAIMDQTVPNMMPRNFRKAFELGLVKEASTIKNLAAKVGLNSDTLDSTVARYNGYVNSGHDLEFGRTHQIGEIGSLVTLSNSPYYIYPCTTALLSTYGGIAIDNDMRVVNVMGQPIPGLYAVGEVTGGLHGAGYLSGSSLAKGAIFGRLSGANAMKRVTI